MESGDGSPEDFLDVLNQRLSDVSWASNQGLEAIPKRLEEFEKQGLTGICHHALESLGTKAGKNDIWRDAYRTTGILEYSLQKVKSGTTASLAKQHLRVIGNSVADNDTNRSVALEALESLINCIWVEELTITALGAIFNLCYDYPPGENRAAKLRLDNIVANHIACNRIPESGIDTAGELIALTSESLSAPELVDDTSLSTLSQLLDAILPPTASVETHPARLPIDQILELCAPYLSNNDLLLKLPPSEAERLLNILWETEPFDPAAQRALYQALNHPLDKQDEESSFRSTRLLINGICAISATEAFSRTYDLQSAFMKKVTSKVLSLSLEKDLSLLAPSTICACTILGNLAISDAVCIEMVNMDLHRPPIRILSTSQESALLHVTAGLLRHLTFPRHNRERLGNAGLINSSCRLLLNPSPAVRGEGAAILCKMVDDDARHTQQYIIEIVQDAVLTTPTDPPHQPTILEFMTNQSLAPSGPLPSTSMKSVNVEVGKAIVAMLKCLINTQTLDLGLLHRMYQTPLLAEPLKRLARQQIFAEARSEAIFGLGLMLLSAEGAASFLAGEHDNVALVDSLRSLFAAESGGNETAGVQLQRDRKNVLVVISGLWKHGADIMDTPLKKRVEALHSELAPFMASNEQSVAE
ncbi:uncharacterized protein BDZ99DRAFT_437434 [Mytilinidion resinicola]|uniref:ARM repeat-containing protein n=1 Tax=Mytilinidion resinicola TaxID=574789 RepID=A0A6A6Z2L7_9PEZI|nr:uncharacterized protein BDZ99DRAFT_437434 [Mytilinidion resinicola]KAF2814477.1 hypothetical protein BDZ99DRAFT_437434 [Mytilinidion resinicola]